MDHISTNSTISTNVTQIAQNEIINKDSFNDMYSMYDINTNKIILMIISLSSNIITTFMRGSNKISSIIGLK